MLKSRILTALVLFPLMLAALFQFDGAMWAAFSWLIIALAMWEFARMAGFSLLQQGAYLATSSAAALSAWLAGYQPEVWLMSVSLVVWLVITPVWLYKRWALPRRGKAVLLGWALFVPAWFAMLAWRPEPVLTDSLQLLAVMGLVWVADISAYFAGKTFGRHKLAPAISPGKTWEGVAGAVLGVTAYVWFVAEQHWMQLDIPNAMLLPIAMALTAVSVIGDLLESWFKRSAGIKDSSRLLPGHGGVFDRIDSLIAVLAVSHALRLILI